MPGVLAKIVLNIRHPSQDNIQLLTQLSKDSFNLLQVDNSPEKVYEQCPKHIHLQEV